MSSTYDPRLIALSIVIAVLSAYTVVDLAFRVTAAKSWAKVAWWIGGTIVMGIGIWSMHFVAMLAFSLPMQMAYNMLTVLISMLPAVFASAGTFYFASRPALSTWQLLIGGTLIGIGIGSIHYIQVLAIRIEATIQYNILLFVLSVTIAIAGSIATLWISFQLRMQTGKTLQQSKIGGGLLIGIAIAAMHYTGMASVMFTPTNPKALSASETTNNSLTWLAVSIGIASLFILGFALMTSFVDRRLTTQIKLLENQEAQIKRSHLFTQITLQIRRSLQLDDVLNTTVHEIRQVLKADRVIIYRFNADWSGTIIAESLGAGWIKTLGITVNDPFKENYIEMYKNGRVRATNNIYKAGFTDCHREILEGFQIKANLIAPLITNNQLVGLLCVHQCSQPRYWQNFEIDLLRQLAIQVSIALQQANLLHELEQSQKDLRIRDRAIAAANKAIFITDPRQPENPIIYCNAAFEKITGYTPQEVIGRNYQFLQGSDTEKATLEQLDQSVRDFRECQVIFKSYRKDESQFWCELTISPVRDTFGQVINFIGVLGEITSPQPTEAELKRAKEDLQSQLLQLLDEVEQAINGDLTVRLTNSEINLVADAFNHIIDNLQQIIIQVRKTAQQLNISLSNNSDAMQQLADKTLKQAGQMSYALGEIDNINQSIQVVADSTHQAEELISNTSKTAQAAKAAMDSTVESILNLQQINAQIANKVKYLSQSSQQIALVASLIQEIAVQTNLLANDANVEIAWMGNQGRSFAVLVEQIAQLAVQSGEATKEIQHILKNIEWETTEVVKIVELETTEVVEQANVVQNTKLTLENIIDASHQINHLMQSIYTATASQTETSQAIALLIKQTAEVSKYTADSSGIVSNSLQQTVELAQQLQASVDKFKIGE